MKLNLTKLLSPNLHQFIFISCLDSTLEHILEHTLPLVVGVEVVGVGNTLPLAVEGVVEVEVQ